MKPLRCASVLIALTASTAVAHSEDTKLPTCPTPVAGMAIDEVGMPVDKKDKKGKGIVTGAGGGAQPAAYNVKSPRDSASGQASGRLAGKSWGDPHEIGTSPAACKHAINTKGTGAAGQAANADQDCDDAATREIKVSASQNGQTLKHAINTKGTGMAGRTDAAGSAGDAPAPQAETVHLYLKANGQKAACVPPKQSKSHDVHELEK